MGRSKHSGGDWSDKPGARNWKGEESKSSKKRREGYRKSEDLATETSPAGKMGESRRKKKKRLDEIMGK